MDLFVERASLRMGKQNWKVGEGIPPIQAFHLQLKHESVLYDDDTKNDEE